MGCVDGWILDGMVEGRTGWMAEWMVGRIDDGRVDGWMDCLMVDGRWMADTCSRDV